jgi:hypothetical protein
VGDDSHVAFGQVPSLKRKRETVRCRDATASAFVAKVRGEVFENFHAVVAKRHSRHKSYGGKEYTQESRRLVLPFLLNIA